MAPPSPSPQISEPLIISASRATDIPAFHGEWFMGRLRAGFCRWRNPFNPAQETTVSFEKTRALVFWTKDPAPFLRFLPEIEASGRQFYFQYTLNDYESERLEPNLPPLSRRLDTFRRLADAVGPRRVVWRFDPLLLGGGLTPECLLERLDRIGRVLAPFTEKLVFSFADMYRKTRCALRHLNPDFRAPETAEMRDLARGIARLNDDWPGRLALATCAEAEDLRDLGVEKNKCIDDALLLRLCAHDPIMREALAPPRRLPLFAPVAASAAKDKGQRKLCGCVAAKDIGAYDTCPHFCVYCYANRSERIVRENMRRCRQSPETRENLL